MEGEAFWTTAVAPEALGIRHKLGVLAGEIALQVPRGQGHTQQARSPWHLAARHPTHLSARRAGWPQI